MMHTTFSACNPLLLAKRGKHTFSFAYFSCTTSSHSSEVYLIKNQSVSAATLPDDSTGPEKLISPQSYFIKTSPKWPFVLLSSDVEWINSLKKLKRPEYIIATHIIDFQSLSKTEKESIQNLFYEN
jgi:hypothetical protein